LQPFKFLGKIAEVNLKHDVPAACKMAMHKGLKQCLTGAHIQYAAGKLVYSAKQNESKWEYLFCGLMDRIWVDESVQAYSINPTIIHEWSTDIIQALKINQIFLQLPPVLQ